MNKLTIYYEDIISFEKVESCITGFGAEGEDFMLHLGPGDFNYPDKSTYTLDITCTISDDITCTMLVTDVLIKVTSVVGTSLLIKSIDLNSVKQWGPNTFNFLGSFTISKLEGI